MTENVATGVVPPFPLDYRASGVLLHVVSLPSPYGIGDFGPGALAWLDRLHDAGQTCWQALPLGPTGYGNSPYQPLSSFAGNELLISPDWLVEDELLDAGDCEGNSLSESGIDYEVLLRFKRQLLEKAWIKFSAGARPDLQAPFENFCDRQSFWLEDYALFRALKAQYKGACYLEWPVALVKRDPLALNAVRGSLAAHVDRVRFAQFILFRQGTRVKQYARAKGVCLFGDLPFYVSPDSSDVWANPELFLIDERCRPRFVAGVPPDYFSAEGQLWGNPVYDWEANRRTGYRWWIDRLRALLSHVDMIRLDHFRAFAAAWHVPAGAPTAQAGQWVPSPGSDFFDAAEKALGSLPFIAEDLGLITPDVHELRNRHHLPGTRVLQFAFDGNPDNPHLPDNYDRNTVVYTGTHDNPTTRAWFEEMPSEQRKNLLHSLNRPLSDSREVAAALITLAWSSLAALAIAPLQDILALGSGAQMNVPGRAEGNWCWRCTEQMLDGSALPWLRDLTRTTCRESATS
jgi:4-alpha-glucanotransferase